MSVVIRKNKRVEAYVRKDFEITPTEDKWGKVIGDGMVMRIADRFFHWCISFTTAVSWQFSWIVLSPCYIRQPTLEDTNLRLYFWFGKLVVDVISFPRKECVHSKVCIRELRMLLLWNGTEAITMKRESKLLFLKTYKWFFSWGYGVSML